jgi:hypothetical protein
LSLLVLDARRGWTASDDYILKLFSKASSSDNKIMTWLNHVEIENLENLVGSIPKSSKPVKRALKQEVIEEA